MKSAGRFLLLVLFASIGYFWGWQIAYGKGRDLLHNTLAISWGDSREGIKSLYQAHVFAEPSNGEFSIQAQICIGGGDYFHDCGKIAKTKTREEAIEHWSTIVWSDEGIRIGKGPNAYFLERKKLESHR